MKATESRLLVGRPLPRGINALPPDVVAAAQRNRLLHAIELAVADRGYVATTIADITAAGGVSRRTFYELFADKEACYLAAYDDGSTRHFAAVRAAVSDDATWDAQLTAGMRCYLEALAAAPAAAAAFLVEIAAAGPEALRRREVVHKRFAGLLKLLHGRALLADPELPLVPDGVFRAAVAGITEIAAATIRGGRTRQLPELLPDLLYMQFALFGAADLAQSSLASVAAPAGRR